MTILRCTQKLLSALRVKIMPGADAPRAANDNARLGDWTLNLLHVRPTKLVLAVSEHDRLGLLLEAAPFSTLTERFTEALFAHLLTLGIPPDIARRECDAMQPLTVGRTSDYDNRLSIQGNMTDYTRLIDWCLDDRMPLVEINARLARQISKPTGYAYPMDLARKRLIQK